MVISVNENSYKCDTCEEYETCIGKAMEEEEVSRLPLEKFIAVEIINDLGNTV